MRLFSFHDVLNELRTYRAVTNPTFDKLGGLRVQTNDARYKDGVAVLDSQAEGLGVDGDDSLVRLDGFDPLGGRHFDGRLMKGEVLDCSDNGE